MDMSTPVKIDIRTGVIQHREIREGNALLMQSRTFWAYPDGTTELEEWKAGIIIPNYGDCYDPKPSFLQRLFGTKPTQ